MPSRSNRHSVVPPIAAVSQLTRRLSNRIRPRRRLIEQVPEVREEDEDELPFKANAKRRELDAETEEITRQSFELERTLEDWGANFQELHAEVETVAKEHAKSTGMRALLRSEAARRRHAQVEYRTAKDVHSIYIESSERTLQDAFIEGEMTLEEYERGMDYLQIRHCLPPSPKKPPATSFRVQRRSLQESMQTTYSEVSMTSLTESSYQSGSSYTAQFHSADSTTSRPYCPSRSRFYIANPSASSSSEELHS